MGLRSTKEVRPMIPFDDEAVEEMKMKTGYSNRDLELLYQQFAQVASSLTLKDSQKKRNKQKDKGAHKTKPASESSENDSINKSKEDEATSATATTPAEAGELQKGGRIEYIYSEELVLMECLRSCPLRDHVAKLLFERQPTLAIKEQLQFPDVVLLLKVFSRESTFEEKCRFSFDFYDLDRDGGISKTDLQMVLTALTASSLSEKDIETVVDATLEEMGGTDMLRLDQFEQMVDLDHGFANHTFFFLS
jgi:Ca2+-binding EF-hand superfamily protein